LVSTETTIGSSQGGSIDVREANSYDFVRFCAASAVLFSHHFDLSGLPEPQVPGYREDFGEVAVEVFFCLSGFLICRSLQRSPGWKRFVVARVLRIFPNLAFVLIVSSLATFLWYRNTANLSAHISYVTDNLMMMVKGVTFIIPAVFTDALRQDVNDPLWTLPYELWCYVLLALVFAFGVARSSVLIVITTVVITAAWTAVPFMDDFDIGPLESFEFFRLGSYFMSGALLAVLWPWMSRYAVVIGVVGLVAGFALRSLLAIDTPLHSLALAACVVGLGSSGAMAWFSRGGDASYGMYVFGWPVQQFILLLIAPFWLSLFVAFGVATVIGYATWHAFERRLTTYPRRLARGGYAGSTRQPSAPQ
jgi:peptidoglycan/LPS O-acetylase OafA/YrhL